MSIKDQEKLIVKLGAKGSPLPGLNLDDILNNLIDKSEEIKEIRDGYQAEIEDLIERGEDDENTIRKQAQDAIKTAIDNYIENMKGIVDEKIALIKQNLKIVISGIKNIISSVKSAISQAAGIATITATPGPGIATFTVDTLKALKNSVGNALNIILAAFGIVLRECTQIKFELPDNVLKTADTLDDVARVINTIPV